jgi:hypothetical protein
MADFCLVECGWFSAEMRTYPAKRTGSVLFLGMRTRSVPIACYRFLLEAVYIMCVDGVNNASCSKWPSNRDSFSHHACSQKESLADTSRTTEENLQCNQHHIRNSCLDLLIFCYRKSSQPSSRVGTFNPDLNKAASRTKEQQSENPVKSRGGLRAYQGRPSQHNLASSGFCLSGGAHGTGVGQLSNDREVCWSLIG